jgi:hypothetical protein
MDPGVGKHVIPDVRGASDPESIFQVLKPRWILDRALAVRPE